MKVIASSNGNVGIGAAVDVLRKGGSALDAVEAGIRLVEANPADRTVGYNGYPNILGQAEMDACIMRGDTLETGAVAGMKDHFHPISVARKVMESLPHVLLVGEGADRFSREMGFAPAEQMVDEEVMAIWEKKLRRDMPQSLFATIDSDDSIPLSDYVRMATDPERVMGTVNFIAQDGDGNICSAVSTSGWGWKYPGRVGDSPIIGAGNYADNRYGACGCTGMGEMAIRANTAHSLVFYMKMGVPLVEAAQRAMTDLRDLGGRFIAGMNLIAMDKDGNHTACTSHTGRTYVWQSAEMDSYEELERTYIDIPSRWA